MQTLPAEHLESGLGNYGVKVHCSLIMHLTMGSTCRGPPSGLDHMLPEGRAVCHLPPSSPATMLAQGSQDFRPEAPGGDAVSSLLMACKEMIDLYLLKFVSFCSLQKNSLGIMVGL